MKQDSIITRNINIDLIKSIAVFFVISVHFFLNNNFYETPINCPRMYIMVIMRTFFMMCVPLFLLITGYLMNKKEFSITYYKGITKILVTYSIITIFTLIAKIILSHFGIFPVEKFSHYINDFIDFKLVEYAWYVEMYIGLFLLIPFINKMFTNRRQDFFLILILLFLTLLPKICQHPTFIVSYWDSLWPITYYTIGLYISKYEIKIPSKKLFCLFILAFSVFSILNLLIVNGHIFKLHGLGAWGGVENTINSVLFFMIILRLNLNHLNLCVKNIVSEIAKLSLGIYLSSYLFDKIVYFYFNQYITSTPAKLEWYIVIVPLVFICSLCMAKLADLIQKLIFKSLVHQKH